VQGTLYQLDWAILSTPSFMSYLDPRVMPPFNSLREALKSPDLQVSIFARLVAGRPTVDSLINATNPLITVFARKRWAWMYTVIRSIALYVAYNHIMSLITVLACFRAAQRLTRP
jgi:hypothetical protein